MPFFVLGPVLVGFCLPGFAFGSPATASFDGQNNLLFLGCLLLILLLSLLGVILLLAHRRSGHRPFQPFWTDLGWGLVPVLLLWGLLIPAAVEVVQP